MLASRIRLHLLILLCTSGLLWGRTGAEEVLSLDQCIALALDRHPLILSSVKRHESSVARIRQATAYPFPTLFFNSDLQPQPLNFKNAGESYLGVNQTFELPQKRAMRRKIAESEAGEVETDIDLVKLEVIFQVKRAFFGLLLAQEKLKYAKRDLELAEDYLQKAELKRTAGDVAQVEVLRAKVEALKAANAVRAAVSNENLARANLNYHLARREEAPLQITGQLQVPFVELSIEDLKREALNLRPELRKLQFSIEKETRTQESARLSNWPDLDFNLSKHRLEGEGTTWSFTLQVPLPFLFKRRQNALIAEAQANVGMLEREIDQVRNTIVLDVEEAYTEAQKARNQILLYQQEILPQAQEVYDMFLFSYQEGEIGGIELIEARRTLNESRKSYADALFEYALALANLEKAVGRRL
jgi:cobalt-zinc-cadmium efflux system outer membrane protein